MRFSGMTDAARRNLLLGFTGVLACKPSPGQTTPLVLVFNPFTDAATRQSWLDGLKEGLAQEGLITGRDVVIDVTTVQVGARLEPEIRNAMDRKAVVVVALTTPVAQVVAREARGRPVVFGIVSDPVGSGLVVSLANPGGHVTGISNVLPELSGKLIELLLEAVPSISSVAAMFNPENSAKILELQELRKAAGLRSLIVQEFRIRSRNDIESAFGTIAARRPDALVILGEALTHNNALFIDQMINRLRLPTVANAPVYAYAMLSFSPRYSSQMPRIGVMVAKIIKGATPAQLPVELPTTFDLLVNQRVFNELGLKIPQSVIVRADRVVQ